MATFESPILLGKKEEEENDLSLPSDNGYAQPPLTSAEVSKARQNDRQATRDPPENCRPPARSERCAGRRRQTSPKDPSLR